MGILDKIKKDIVAFGRKEVEKYLKERGKSLDQVADSLEKIEWEIDELHQHFIEGVPIEEIKKRETNDDPET